MIWRADMPWDGQCSIHATPPSATGPAPQKWLALAIREKELSDQQAAFVVYMNEAKYGGYAV